MTRDEAIKVLRTESVELGGNAVSVCRFFEAVDMAVTALLEQDEAKSELRKYHESYEAMARDLTKRTEQVRHLQNAISAIRQQERFGETNKSLTLDDLSERNAPVFVPINDFPNGGYWCLCENGYIIPPSGYGFMAKDRPNWVFYRQKPEEGTD